MSIGPYGQPSVTPSPEGGTALSPPLQQQSSDSSSGLQFDAAGTPQDFVNLAKAKLQAMIGSRYYLVDDATLNDIADKLWQSVTIQQSFGLYQQSPSTYAGTLEGVIASTVLNPTADPSVDPTITQDYITAKESAGESLSAAELTALATATQAANAPVPRPFNESTVSGYDYGTPMPAGGWTGTGQSYGWSSHMGVDYGTRAGERITSPFAGTAHVLTGVEGYGNYVTVRLDNGWTIGFGHVASGAVQDGARVNPGDLIAIAGANIGSAQGSVTIVTWQDPQGNYANPHQVLDPIFNGTTFSSLSLAGAAGTGSPSFNSVLDREYPSIKSDWVAMFGSPPSPEDVYNVLQHGTSPTQWTDYIRSLPGHIDGMTVGQIYDLRTLADTESMKALGHAATDGIVKELHEQGLTGQQQVKFWYDEHSPNEIDKTTYDNIAKVLQPNMDGALNDNGVDPRMVKAVHERQVATAEKPGHF